MQTKITIVTATYNLIASGRMEMFEQCIKSVAMQKYDNYEHIIIDGASTDGTVEILQKYAEQGLISYYSEPDTGIYNAFNKGIKKSTGKYIAFLGSDDFYTRNDAFSLVTKALEEKNADFTYAPFDVVDYNENFRSILCPCLKKFPLKMPFGHPTMFAAKDMLEALNCFDETYRIAADFDLINRALLKGYVPEHVNTRFVAFRQGGISTTFIELCAKEDIKVISRTLNLSEKKATEMRANNYVPTVFLKKLLKHLSPTIETSFIVEYNNKNYLKHLKHLKQKFFYFRWRQDKKTLRLLGVTLYNKCNI